MSSAKLNFSQADPVAPARLARSGCCVPVGEESRRRAVPTSSSAAANAEREEVDLGITRSRSLSVSSGNASLELLPASLPNHAPQLCGASASGVLFLVFVFAWDFFFN